MRLLLVALLAVAPTSLTASASAQRDEAVVNRVLGNVAELVTSSIDPEVPAGSVRVLVTDRSGAAVAEQAVRLGIMQQSGARDSEACLTDAAGMCAFEGLSTDSKHSYRVNVPYGGARTSSAPFRLDAEQGHQVRVVRLETTTDDSRVFQVLGRTMIEFRDGRARITQEARLANLGDKTYVFPADGMPIRLPAGFKAFDTRAAMTDQQLTATDTGLDVTGSIPPGRVDLLWAYDIPLGGSSMTIEQRVPFATMEYQVVSDYIDGMSLEVEGFQVARVHEGADRRFLVAGLMRRPGDPPVDPLRIRLRGIPGSGPLPIVATLIALLFVVLGVTLLLRPADQSGALAEVRAGRRDELLDEIASLERQHEEKLIGPTFYEHRRRELTDELAIVLRMQREATGH